MLSNLRTITAPNDHCAPYSQQSRRKISSQLRLAIARFHMLMLFFVLSFSVANAQGTYCPDQQCNAQQFRDAVFFLADSTGTPLTSTGIVAVQPVFVWLTFTSTEKTDQLSFHGDLQTPNSLTRKINTCLGNFNEGIHTIKVGPVNWKPGEILNMHHILFSWQGPGEQINCGTCPGGQQNCKRWDVLPVNTIANVHTAVTSGNADFPGNTNKPVARKDTIVMRIMLDITDGCDQVISNVASALIIPDIQILTQPGNVTECIGGTNTMSVTISGGSGTITYQWQQSPDGTTNWTNATGGGATTSTFTPPSTVAGTTYYRVLVNASDVGCDQAVSNTATAIISPDLTVTTQPTNVTECVGGTNTMTVAVSGGSGTISYQWQQSPNGTNSWTNATGAGATTDTYTPSSAVAGTTYYRVLVNASNNGCDQAVSNNATAIIIADLVVTTQPTNVTECIGGTNTMTVAVSGGSGTITYQWQQSPNGTDSWTNATGAGATTNTYTPASDVAGTTYYRVLVNAANNGCDQVVSNTATAIISPDLAVTTQPTDVSECVGGTNTMTVAVSGGSGTITYQWQQSPNGTNSWTNATGAGATTSTYTPSSAVAGTTYYRVIVNAANNGCDQAVSNTAIATIIADLVVTTQPTNVTECIGGTNTMTVAVSGGSGTITYQWQQSPNGTDSWTNATGGGATTNTYTPSSAVAGTTYYRVLVNAANNGCDQVVSNTATAIISPEITVTTQPTDVFECVGGTNTMSVAITGGSGTITYQWQQSPNGTNSWTNATGAGATTNTYTPSSAAAGTTYYRVLVNASDNGCDQAVSNNAIATIIADLVVTTQPTNVTECIGGTNTMTVAVSGGSGTITYQWQSSPDGSSNWTNATGAGATTDTYTPSSASAGTTYYRVLVNASNNGCDQVVSNTATAIISPDLVVTTQPTNVTECVGGTNTMTVAVSGGSGTITYQWQSSPDGSSNWTNATGAGATTNIYTPSSASAGTTYYRVLVNASNNGCDQVVSNTATAIITPDITITTQPTSINECVGGTNTMTVSVSGGSGTISYQWQQSPNGTDSWTNATGAGATTETYTPSSAVPGTTYYRVLVNASNNGCDQAVSNTATAIISPDLTVTTQPTNVTECIGGTNTMTVAVSGGSGTITYQWQSSPDGSTNWVNATGAGATTNTYTPSSAVAGTTYYRVLVNAANNGCDQVVSNTATAVIIEDITITTQPTNVTECIGGTNTMTVSISGGSGAITYQWQSSPDGSTNWTNATGAGATTSTYTPSSAVAGTTYYRVLVNAANSGCDQAVSNTATAIISPDLTITTQPTNVNECIGGTNTMTVAVSGGSGAISYQWQSSPDGSTNWTNATGAGATSSTYTPSSAVAGTTYYRVLVNAANNGCDQVVSNTATAIITEDITITTQPTNVTECIGGTNTMTVAISGGSGAITYQWQSSLDGSTNWTNATGAGATTSTYTPSSTVAGTTYYRVLVNAANNGCEQAVSNTATAIISPDLAVVTQPTDVSECVGGTNTMTVAVSGGSGAITYQWQQSPNGTNSWTNATGAGATTDTYTPSSAVAGTTYYRVLVNAANSGCDQVVSNNAVALIIADIVITTQPTNVTECIGGTNTMTVAISGGSGAITYQWQSSPDGSTNWTNATGAGATTDTYTPSSAVAGTTYYRVLVNAANSGCDQTVSNTATAIISPDLTMTTQPTDVSECIGGTNTMTVAVSGGSGSITYQWQQSPNGTDSWTNATGAGATTTTYTPSSAAAGTTYYRVLINASNSGCDQVVSNTATAIISPDLIVTTQPTSIIECIGGAATMTVVISGGSGAITYQWQQSPNGTSGWANATGAGATTATYTPESAVAGTTYYRVLINAANAGCDQVISNTATAIISPDLVVTTQPTNVTECIGGNQTMTVAVTGGSGTISYQWQQSPNGTSSWVNATGAGATSTTYMPESTVAGTTYYRVLINASSTGCEQAISNTATAIISPDLAITNQPIGFSECVGGIMTLEVSISGGTGTVNYQWQQSTTGTGSWTNATGSGSTTSIFTPPSDVVGTTYYRVIITTPGSGCEDVISNTVIVEIEPDLAVSDHPDKIIECVGGTSVMSVEVTGGAGTIVYQWQQSADGVTGWTDIPGANSSTYAPSSATPGLTYYRVIINSN
jgi:hypothetical protein